MFRLNKKQKKIFSVVMLTVVVLSIFSPFSFKITELSLVGLNIANAQVLLPAAVVNALAHTIWQEFLNTLNWILARFAELALYITGFFLGLVSMLLNEVVTQTIIKMSSNLSAALAEGGGINLAWTAFRDIANLFFIFVILYIAIMTILRTDTATTKKLLVHVVIIALLLNFSLFFTKVIIDASNIPAIYFYEQVSQAGGENGLAGAFMQKFGVTSVFDPTGYFGAIKSGQPWEKIIILGVFGSILFMVSGIVFLAVALMLIIRFFILVFLMIFSPLAFVAMALPEDRWSKKWWDTLFSQAIFAPALFAFIFVALSVMDAITTNLGSGASFGNLAAETGGAPQQSTTQLFLNFLMVIGILIFSLLAAKEVGAQGSAGAIKFARKSAGAYLSPLRQLGAPTARTAIRMAGLRKAYEKATQTRAFQGQLPKWLGGKFTGGMLHSGMERTLGATVKGKIGKKSVLEAYEEDEELTSRRRAIKDLTAARRAEKIIKKSKDPAVRAKLKEKRQEIMKLEEEIKNKLYTEEMKKIEEQREERKKEVSILQEQFSALMKIIAEKEAEKAGKKVEQQPNQHIKSPSPENINEQKEPKNKPKTVDRPEGGAEPYDVV